MDIKEAIQARRDLEQEIASFVSGKLAKFKYDTGLRVDSVDIQMMPANTFGEPDVGCVVSGVDVGVHF